MKGNCKLVTPPSPLFLKSGDSRGFKGAVSGLESISLELKILKGLGRERGEGFEVDCADNTGDSNTHS